MVLHKESLSVALLSAALASILFFGPVTPSYANGRAPFTLDNLFAIEGVSSVAISPSGEQVALVSEHRTQDNIQGRNSRLWLVSTVGGKLRPAVDNPNEREQSTPIWSPDGKLLLYRTKDKNGKSMLRLLRLQGQPHVSTLAVCVGNETVASVTWAPDSRKIAVMCYGASAQVSEEAEAEQKVIIASQSSFYDGMGKATAGRRVMIFDLASHQLRQLAKGDNFLTNDGSLIWRTPDVLWITGTDGVDYTGTAEDRVFLRVDVATGAARTWGYIKGAHSLLVSPDGRDFVVPVYGTIAAMDSTNWKDTWKLQPFHVTHLSADGDVLSTSAALDIFVSRHSDQVWAPAPDKRVGGVVYFNWLDGGSLRVRAYSPATQGWSEITPEGKNTEAFSVTADGSKMAIIQGDANTPSEVYVVNLRHPSEEPLQLTHFGDAVRKIYLFSSVEALQWQSGDHRFTVNGWLLKPPNFEPGKRYPMIVDVHGGPGVAFPNRFDTLHFDGAHQVPPELYAARGYLVLMVNPRGDPGYGRDYQESLREGFPNAVRYDIFTGIDEMIRRGYADESRLGIAGASYGGWAAAFAVSQTDRFKAASASDPMLDLNVQSALAYRGPDPSNFWMNAGFGGGLPGDVPLPTVDPRLVKTPTLLRFGVGRQEFPFPSQFFVSGLEYFSYLDSHCVPVEMIIHTQEGHGIDDWTTLRDYIGRDLAWFDYWIKGDGEPPIGQNRCARPQ
jgi:dipeptidyl aminopeptidase/acylaminoacyl peptidase